MEFKLRLRYNVLVIFTGEEAKTLFNGGEGTEVLAYLVRRGDCCREYYVDSNWVREAAGNIESERYVLNRFAPEIERIADAWKWIKKESVKKPVGADAIRRKLVDSVMNGGKLQLFSPWGPRYKKSSSVITDEDLEITTLREIKSVFAELGKWGYSIDFLLMPADTYGIEINGRSSEPVREYFKNLEDAAYAELGEIVKMKPWSIIREENGKRYDELKSELEKDLNNRKWQDELQRAIGVARYFNPTNIVESAKKYCLERLAEGIIITEVYDPIKLSLVRKEKDTLDGPLNRIYIVKNRAPWLDGGE